MMIDEGKVVWLRYRYSNGDNATHLMKAYSLSVIDGIAREKSELMRERGEVFANEAVRHFAGQLALALEDASLSGNPLSLTMDKNLERCSAELITLLYAHTIEFTSFEVNRLVGATFECSYEHEHRTAGFHLSLSGNLNDERLLCSSVQLESFFEEQRKLRSKTLNILHSDVLIVDDIARSLDNISNICTNSSIESTKLFILSTASDLVPACSLVLGGRLDAAHAIVRRNIEVLGLARILRFDESAAELWERAHNDDHSWKAFKRKFKLRNMFPATSKFWNAYFEIYDDLAKKFHPNPRSFSNIQEIERDEINIRFKISSMSFSADESAINAVAFASIVYVFSMILIGYTEIVSKSLGSTKPKEVEDARLRAADIYDRAWVMLQDKRN